MLATSVNLEGYVQACLPVIPRVFTLGDRLPDSDTYGCFDRYYWHYRVLDFANARFQEVAWLLALLYTQDFPQSAYYQKNKVKAWAIGAIDFWSKIQKSDGSVDEVYPFEHSFVSTAFSTFAITEALLILNDPHITQRFLQSVQKSGQWLAAHNNMRVANQMAGAAAALYNVYLLTQQSVYQQAAAQKVQKLATLQHDDGYFIEYGGFDMGYLSIGLSYLVRYFEKSADPQAQPMIQKAINFANTKVFDNGTYDYSETSRHTQYIYPYGFLQDPQHQIIQKQLSGLSQNRVVSPISMDDRFFIPLTIDFLTTYAKGAAQ